MLLLHRGDGVIGHPIAKRRLLELAPILEERHELLEAAVCSDILFRSQRFRGQADEQGYGDQRQATSGDHVGDLLKRESIPRPAVDRGIAAIA
jgi:hypothetical protein